MVCVVVSAIPTAALATRAASVALFEISRIEAIISSELAATTFTLAETSSLVADAALACCAVSPAFVVSCWLTAVNCSAEAAMAIEVSPMAASNSAIPLRIFTWSVTSVANLTTLKGLPFRSKIGLYDAWIHTSLPPLPIRLYSPD